MNETEKQFGMFGLGCGECVRPAPDPSTYRIVKQTSKGILFECANCGNRELLLLEKCGLEAKLRQIIEKLVAVITDPSEVELNSWVSLILSEDDMDYLVKLMT